MRFKVWVWVVAHNEAPIVIGSRVASTLDHKSDRYMLDTCVAVRERPDFRRHLHLNLMLAQLWS